MEQYFYKVGFYAYEDSRYITLTHSSKFRKKQFDKIMCRAVVKAIKEAKKQKRIIHSFEGLFDLVVDVLIKDYGFKKSNYELTWSCFGWASLFKKDWKEDTDDNLKMIRKWLKEKGFTKKDDML